MEIDEKQKIDITLAALKRRGFDARFAENREVAREMAVELVPDNAIISVGDSATIRSLGLLQELVDLGHDFLGAYSQYYRPRTMTEKLQPATPLVGEAVRLGCDVFLASSNAITQDGKIVNIDGGGNRVAGIIREGRLAILVVGRNKIVKDVDEALYRIKNVIYPLLAKSIAIDNGMLCRAAGKCVEPDIFCDPGVRACTVVMILESIPAMRDRKIVVILVDEDLGLGFDPTWPQERKDKICAELVKYTPPHALVRNR